MSPSIVAHPSPLEAHNRNCRPQQSSPPGGCRGGSNSKRSPVKQAVRRFSEASPAPAAPSTASSPATVIQLSALSGGKAMDCPGAAIGTPPAPPVRRGSRGRDLVFGGILALILLIACLTWEMLSDRDEPPHAALQGQTGYIPAAR
jgi:hypothetical protein